MKNLFVRYSVDNDALVEKMENYVKDICASDCAIVEPSCDMELDWLFTTLIMGICECYFEHTQKEGTVIIGIAAVDLKMVQIFIDEPRICPQECLLAVAEYQGSSEYVTFYLEV